MGKININVLVILMMLFGTFSVINGNAQYCVNQNFETPRSFVAPDDYNIIYASFNYRGYLQCTIEYTGRSSHIKIFSANQPCQPINQLYTCRIGDGFIGGSKTTVSFYVDGNFILSLVNNHTGGEFIVDFHSTTTITPMEVCNPYLSSSSFIRGYGMIGDGYATDYALIRQPFIRYPNNNELRISVNNRSIFTIEFSLYEADDYDICKLYNTVTPPLSIADHNEILWDSSRYSPLTADRYIIELKVPTDSWQELYTVTVENYQLNTPTPLPTETPTPTFTATPTYTPYLPPYVPTPHCSLYECYSNDPLVAPQDLGRRVFRDAGCIVAQPIRWDSNQQMLVVNISNHTPDSIWWAFYRASDTNPCEPIELANYWQRINVGQNGGLMHDFPSGNYLVYFISSPDGAGTYEISITNLTTPTATSTPSATPTATPTLTSTTTNTPTIRPTPRPTLPPCGEKTVYIYFLSDADGNITLPVWETSSLYGVRTWVSLPLNLCGGASDVEITATTGAYTMNAYGIGTGINSDLPIISNPYYTVMDLEKNEVSLRIFLQPGTKKLADGPNIILKIIVGTPATQIVLGPMPN